MGPMMYSMDGDSRIRADLSHLPEDKQRELEQIVALLRAVTEVEMIILFGSYARGDYKEVKDLAPKRWSGHVSDYDLLVIVADPAVANTPHIRKAFRDVCKAQGFSAQVNPIVHDIQDINANLAEGRYFFLDIKREGRLLYDSGRFELDEPRQLPPAEAQAIAQSDFEQWYDSAKGFYIDYENARARNDLRKAVFYLNQATESAYKCILLVFTGYCPHEHLLEWLGERAELYGSVYRDLFPQRTEQEQQRFELLDKAYIGARYMKSFIVFPGDLDYLAPRVQRLLELTDELCRQRIAMIGSGAR